jgi:hypothetical protein
VGYRRLACNRIGHKNRDKISFPLDIPAAPGFEELAMPLFDSLYNFRAWMFRILRNTFLSSRTKFERRMTDALDSEKDGPDYLRLSPLLSRLLVERSGND